MQTVRKLAAGKNAKFLFQSFKAQWSLYVPPVEHSPILRSAHTVYLCVLCGSQSK